MNGREKTIDEAGWLIRKGGDDEIVEGAGSKIIAGLKDAIAHAGGDSERGHEWRSGHMPFKLRPGP